MAWRAIVVWLVCLSLAGAAFGQVKELRRIEIDARGDVERALVEYRRAEADSSPGAGAARAKWVEAEARYRRAVAARLIAQAAESPDAINLAAQEQELRQRQQRLRAAAAAHLEDQLASGRDSVKAYADMEATLRTLRLEKEVLGEAARRQRPQIAAGAGDLRGRTKVSTTTQRLDELLHAIATKDANEPRNNRRAREHEIEMWLRERERDMDLEEYQRLAQHGIVISERTGRAITGVQRERLARDAEKQLSEAVAYHARDKRFLDLWSNTDSRQELAARLKERVDSAQEYKALEFLSPSQESMPQYYQALAHAVRRQQSEVDEWYTNTYLGQTEADSRRGAFGNAVNAWWNTGFGTLARANDISGETSDTHVRSRLDQMRGETDAAAEALMAAARTPNPALLPERQRELLRAYGYIEQGPDQRLRYALPSGRRQLGDLTRAELPGASWLDALSMETVAVTAASVALPELAAARAAAWATRAGAGAGAVRAASVGTGIGTSMAVDAGGQWLATGEVDASKLVLDNLLIGTATGKASEALGKAVTSRFGALMKDTRLARALRESGEGSALIRETEALVRNATGVGSEAVLQSYIQSVLAGNPGLTREDVLANLATGALARTMAGARRPGTDDTSILGRDRGNLDFDKVVNRLTPPGLLRDMLTSRDLPLAMEERARAEHWTENNRAAWERFMKVTDNGREVSEARIGEAVLKGEFSWNDLKTVAADSPTTLKPMHEAIARAREKFYKEVDVEARERATLDLEREYQQKAAELARRGLDGEQLRAQREQLDAWRGDELRLINEDAARLGSEAASSDIDRSWRSDRVRKAAKEVEEAKLYRSDQNRPGPTSARAYDLNEYYDVMPFIKETFNKGMDLSQQPGAAVGATGATMNHSETMSAGSLAAAMLHMDPAQRARFERNRLEAASPAERRALETQFAWAKENLAENSRLLDERSRRIAEQTGRDASDPDVRLTARDQLYGERTKQLHDLERQIGSLPDQQGPEAMRLRAQWEQQMAVALREGIETYSQTAGLDLICNTLQGEVKQNRDGSPMLDKDNKPIKKKARELISEADFTIEGRLKGKYTAEQLDGMLNDQVMFLAEHVNGYRQGHESAEAAARAIGKYGERALLALHVKGELSKLPKDHPLRKFAELTEQLVDNKDNPAGLRDLLATMDPGGDPDRGMRTLLHHLDAIPGMEGISSVEPSTDPAAINLARQAARRRWQSERDDARLFGGSEAELALLERQQVEAEEEMVRLAEAKDGQAALDGAYLRADQGKAQRLESELGALEERLHHLPGGSQNTTETAKQLRDEIAERQRQLEELRDRYARAGSPTDQGDEIDRQREARLEELTVSQDELAQAAEAVRERIAVEELQRAREAHEQLLEDPSGSLANERLDREEDGLPVEPPYTGRPQLGEADPGPAQRCAGGGLELRTSQLRYRIGETIELAYSAPEDRDWPLPELVLYNEHGRKLASRRLPVRGAGELSIPGSIIAGNVELRAVGENGQTLCSIPLQVVAIPAPGAISISGDPVQPVGAKVVATVRAPEGTWHSSPWLGLFELGHAGGEGAVRRNWWRLKSLDTEQEITLPATGGLYELRLFDRDDGFYMLDALRIRTVPQAAPAALSIPKHEYRYGESVEVSISIPEDVYIQAGDAWVGLFRVTKEGQRISDMPARLGYHHVHQRTASVQFTAPATPELCEIRLYDRGANAIMLDSLRFSTRGQLAPGSLDLEQASYKLGEDVRVRIRIPEGVYFQPGNAWVGLFAAQDELSEVRPRRASLAHQYLHSREAELVFKAPVQPGEYQLELYDRGGDHVLLDAISFTTHVQGAPGSIRPSAEVVNIGQEFTVQLDVPEGVYIHGWGRISLHHMDSLVGPARAAPAGESHYIANVGRNGMATFTAPTFPGNFELRLYDREHHGYVLDSASIRVAVPQAPGAIRLTKDQFAPGEAIEAGIELPPDVQLFSWALLGVHPVPRAGVDSPEMSRIAYAYIDRKTMTASLRAPTWPGMYEIRLQDRENQPNRLDRRTIQVVMQTAPGALRAPETAKAGSTIAVEFELPDDIYRQNSARIALVRLRSTAPGGAWIMERQLAGSDLPRDARGSVELRIPQEPGVYELRLYDRSGEGLIIDRRPFTIVP